MTNDERLSKIRLRAEMVKAWNSLFDVPGFPIQSSGRGHILIGGFIFWVIVGSFYLFLYSLLIFYAMVVVFFRLVWAILLSLIYGSYILALKWKYR